MNSLSFDSMASLYDQTRVFNQHCFDAALDFLVKRNPPKNFTKIFYPGMGTGRVAIPLAQRGYHITGIDISDNMLALLDKRLKQVKKPLPVSFRQADVLKLPFPDATFDMALTVHFFYFIPQWKLAIKEILRVIKDDSPLILMHTGSGLEIPFLNERYKELCAEQGFPIKQIGVTSNKEIAAYCQALGYSTEWIRDRWQWTQHIRLDKALDYVKSRAYSFTTLAPHDVHSKAVTKLESELRQQFGSLSTQVDVPNQIYLAVLQKSR